MECFINQTSCANTPPQYWVVEWKNRHLLEVAEDFYWEWKFPIRIPSKAWCLNLMMAAYLSKKTMAPIIGERSPLHVIFGRFTLFQTVDYSNLRVFGCTCFVHIPSPAQDKLSPTSHPVCFLEWGWGTPRLKRATSVNDPSTRRFHLSRHVTFFEHLLRSSGALRFPVMVGLSHLRGRTMEEFMGDSIRILRFNRVSKIRVTRVISSLISLRGSFAGLWRLSSVSFQSWANWFSGIPLSLYFEPRLFFRLRFSSFHSRGT